MKKIFLTILIFSGIFISFEEARAQVPLKILIVPGHDDESWGAQYGNLKDADMNLALATKIYDLLKEDGRLDIHITRDTNGYTKEFADYFENERDNIIAFKNSAKAKTQKKISRGDLIVKEGPPHNNVDQHTAVVLYGINKWANENGVDAVIHVHFNDHVRKSIWALGKYKGFAIYLPEEQMVNAKESKKLAQEVFKKLNEKYITSTYSGEEGGLVSEQDLIAIGANGTLSPSVRAILIEYGYIYRFGDKYFRQKAYGDMADLTLAGLKNYFNL